MTPTLAEFATLATRDILPEGWCWEGESDSSVTLVERQSDWPIGVCDKWGWMVFDHGHAQAWNFETACRELVRRACYLRGIAMPAIDERIR